MFKINKRLLSLGSDFYSHVNPNILENPRLVHVNRKLQVQLGLGNISDHQLCNWLSGYENVANYSSLATVYSGHQFGIYVPQLGDGRALIIAEYEDLQGRTWELQLKGSGRTPYSRMGDGLAVLRSSIREYLGSHALHCLGIPTTEALAIIDSDTKAYREQIETAASILRVAPTFIRFGHFEFWARQGNVDNLRKLTNFISQEYFPKLDREAKDFIPKLLENIASITAKLIATWQAVGFVHGVLNSDNMSIVGLTLDYGPYAFMDSFRPHYAYNHSDGEGRYVYARQPDIGLWNLCRLADALTVIYPKVEELEKVLHTYISNYNNYYLQLMAHKLGIFKYNQNDFQLIDAWLKILFDYSMDWTYSWRKLSYGQEGKSDLQQQYNLGEDFSTWYQNWQSRLLQQDCSITESYQAMQRTNPALVPRTNLLQNAIHRAQFGDYSEVNNLFMALSKPYEELEGYSHYYQLPPITDGDIALSCSS